MDIPIRDRKRDGSRFVGPAEVGDVAVEFEPPETMLGQEPGYHDQTQHHRQQQIEEIVARVDSRNADSQRKEKKTGSIRRQTNRSTSGEQSEVGGENVPQIGPRLYHESQPRWNQTGTGIVSTISRMMRSACSKLWARIPCARFSMTRWERTTGASSL